jgi:tetratricopeptide (TPR) repeat protein/CHAT domain-containing protein
MSFQCFFCSTLLLRTLLCLFCLFYFQLPADAQNNTIKEVNRLLDEAEKLVANGNHIKALPLQARALAICEKALGPEHPGTGASLSRIAATYTYMGDYAKALPLQKRAVAIREKALGPQHLDTGASLIHLAMTYTNMGDYAKALPLQKRALAICEKALGPEHPNTSVCLNELATTYTNMGDYAKALPLQKRALAICEKALGPQHPDTAASLNELAATYMKMSGDYAKALPLYERALAIREKALGPQHPQTAVSLEWIATTYSYMSDYAKALPLQERALVIYEKALGPQHPQAAQSLSGIATTYSYMGDYAKALPLYERALAILEKALGPQHPETARSLNNLADAYAEMSDYAKALPLIERAVAIREKALGPQHPDTAASLNELANTYTNMGDYAKALPLYERALAIREKALGPQHPDTATSLSNLAITYKDMGDYAEALSLYERARAIREKALGPQHPDTGASLSNLAVTYWEMGDYAKALPLLERALAIREKALGPQHPETAMSLSNLAIACYHSENLNMSRMYTNKKIAATHRQLQSILSLDERTRLLWQRANLSYWYACVLRADPLAELSLRWKGVVLDSLLEDRALAMAADKDSEGVALLDEMRALRGKLAKILIEKDSDTEVANIEKRIGQIQVSLAKRANINGRVRSAVDMTIDAVVPALTQGALLVDFIRFSDPKLNGDENACYGAILTGEDATSRFVRIDGAVAIDRAVDDLRSAIVQSNEKLVEEKTLFLSEKIWKPLSAQIPQDTKQLIICPEEKLNFLSFAALLDQDGHFIAEKYPIYYISSARDLTRKSSGKVSQNLVIYAAPAFDATGSLSAAKDNLAMRSAEADAFGAIDLPPLPGTEAEAKAIQSIANDVSWSTKVVTGHEATEASVRATKEQAVLHLATHGFYLNSFTPTAPAETRGMSVIGNTENVPKQDRNGVDPMRASGVALTGATQTLKQWSQRKAPESETDGILTADEVASLNLNGTWLVTLSACETGVGEARNGEGVFGLRRAFMMAGAENLLMTLWPVSDHTTAEIMASFYKEALTSHDAVGSLAKVQRDWLVKLRKEKGFLAAVRDAAPFAMVTMTAPTHPPVSLPQPIQEASEVPESSTKTAPKTKPH